MRKAVKNSAKFRMCGNVMRSKINQSTNLLSLQTIRLSMGGAILGVAVMGLLFHFPHHDELGAILGTAAVFLAKARHFI
jgi:hypothetical protein